MKGLKHQLLEQPVFVMPTRISRGVRAALGLRPLPPLALVFLRRRK